MRDDGPALVAKKIIACLDSSNNEAGRAWVGALGENFGPVLVFLM